VDQCLPILAAPQPQSGQVILLPEALVNNSSVDLAFVYVSPTGVDAWGADAMGTDLLPAGQSVAMNFSGSDDATCVYDIKVVGTEGQEGYLYKVDLCSVSQVSFGDS
jgi:hypothetical protein